MASSVWTEEEDQVLAEIFPEEGYQGVRDILVRHTENQIRCRATELKITCRANVMGGRPVRDPTLDEIAERAAAIRSRWDFSTLQRRLVKNPEGERMNDRVFRRSRW